MTESTGGIDMDEGTSGVVKKFLYVNRKAPYGTIYALESLEVVLIAAAFDQDVSLAFLDDGVYQIAKGQHTKGIDVNPRSNRLSHRNSAGCAANCRPGRRRNNVPRPISSSRRANSPPKHRCGPWPKATCLFGVRVISKRSGLENCSGS